MTSIKMDIIANKELASFPSAEEILSQWKTRYKVAREANPGSEIRGVSLVDESGAIYAWLKFGPTVTMAEGRTQNYVAQVVNGDATAPVRVPSVFLTFESNRWGFIVMEFIDGETCDDQDSNDVAIALQFLVNIEGPNSVPGPIGGGRIRHPFFIDRESEVPYDSVGLLQAHVNSILKLSGRTVNYVDLEVEVKAYGLRLCPADLNRGNFKKDRTNKIVALDFGATCFLPISFFEHALKLTDDRYTTILARLIKLPKSNNYDAISQASFALITRRSNKFGLPNELRGLVNKRGMQVVPGLAL